MYLLRCNMKLSMWVIYTNINMKKVNFTHCCCWVAEQYEEASKQFRDDVAVNPNDTEEAIWAFLAEAQLIGHERARQDILKACAASIRLINLIQHILICMECRKLIAVHDMLVSCRLGRIRGQSCAQHSLLSRMAASPTESWLQ